MTHPRRLSKRIAALLVPMFGVTGAFCAGAAAQSTLADFSASDAGIEDQFGFSADLCGDLAIIGANQAEVAGGFSGSAYIFARNHDGADNWGLTGSVHSPMPEGDTFFGYCTALDSGRALIGAPREGESPPRAGMAYLFMAPFACPGDLNADRVVNILDLNLLLGNFQNECEP